MAFVARNRRLTASAPGLPIPLGMNSRRG
jgi:hypothetical protein